MALVISKPYFSVDFQPPITNNVKFSHVPVVCRLFNTTLENSVTQLFNGITSILYVLLNVFVK